MTNFDNRGHPLRSAGVFAAVVLAHAGVAYALATTKGVTPLLRVVPPLEAVIVADTPTVSETEPPPSPPALPDLAPPPDMPMPDVAVDTPPPEPTPAPPPPEPTPAPLPEPPPQPPQPQKPPEKPKPEKPKHEPVKHEKPAKPQTPHQPAAAVPAKAGPAAAAPSIDRSQSCPPPKYPREAEDAGATGVTYLQFVIDADGRVTESSVTKSSGYASLDQAALRALSRCKFNPGIANGQRQRASLSLTYRWQLDN